MPIDCVGGVVYDEQDRLLLVRRGHPPAQGTWSIPGGRVEPGESDVEALTREMLEETGLAVLVGRLAGQVRRAELVIRDYHCVVAAEGDARQAQAGDDAADLGWFTVAEVRALDTSPGLVDTLTEWGVLPAEAAP